MGRGYGSVALEPPVWAPHAESSLEEHLTYANLVLAALRARIPSCIKGQRKWLAGLPRFCPYFRGVVLGYAPAVGTYLGVIGAEPRKARASAGRYPGVIRPFMQLAGTPLCVVCVHAMRGNSDHASFLGVVPREVLTSVACIDVCALKQSGRVLRPPRVLRARPTPPPPIYCWMWLRLRVLYILDGLHLCDDPLA